MADSRPTWPSRRPTAPRPSCAWPTSISTRPTASPARSSTTRPTPRTPRTTPSSRHGGSGRPSGPGALRALVRPDPRQHLSRPAAIRPPAGDRHLGRGRHPAGDPFGQANDRDLLANAIASLSPDHRVVVALRYYRDLPVGRSPAGWASRQARSSRASTTPSSDSTPPSTPPTARERSDDRRTARTAPAGLVSAEVPADETAPSDLRTSLTESPGGSVLPGGSYESLTPGRPSRRRGPTGGRDRGRGAGRGGAWLSCRRSRRRLWRRPRA